MRRELHVRLTEAATNDDGLSDLVGFLRDDLAFAPGNRSIIGFVLREQEFAAWRHLMNGVRSQMQWPVQYDPDEVRALARNLKVEMERT